MENNHKTHKTQRRNHKVTAIKPVDFGPLLFKTPDEIRFPLTEEVVNRFAGLKKSTRVVIINTCIAATKQLVCASKL